MIKKDDKDNKDEILTNFRLEGYINQIKNNYFFLV